MECLKVENVVKNLLAKPNLRESVEEYLKGPPEIGFAGRLFNELGSNKPNVMEVNDESPSMPQNGNFLKSLPIEWCIDNLLVVKFVIREISIGNCLRGHLYGGFHGSKVIIKGSTA